MRKKRRSSQFKDNSKVIDMDEARRKRREKHKLDQSRAKSKSRERSKVRAHEPEKRMTEKGKQALRKKIKRRRFIMFVVTAVVLIIAGFHVLQIIKLELQKSELEKKHEMLLEKKKQVKEEIKSQNKDERVEEEARSKLKLAKPGETVYIPKELEKSEDGLEDE